MKTARKYIQKAPYLQLLLRTSISGTEAKLFDRFGALIATPEVVGEAPVLIAGENTVTLDDSSVCKYQKRASVTFRTHGDIIE